jgi:hypothetical protein
MANEKLFSLINSNGQKMDGFYIRANNIYGNGDLFQVRANGEHVCVMTAENYAKVLASGKFRVVEEVSNA